MSRLAHCVIAFVLLSLSAQAATYYECLVLAGTNGGYASFVTPDKAVNPWAGYYQAYRADIPWGPSTVNYVTNSVTNLLYAYWTMEQTNYGKQYSGGATQPTFAAWLSSNDLVNFGSTWSSNNLGRYDLDGLDDYLGPNDLDCLKNPKEFSLFAWVRVDQTNDSIAAIATRTVVGAGWQWNIRTPGYIEWRRLTASPECYVSTGNIIASNTWYFLGATCYTNGPTNKLDIYVDAAMPTYVISESYTNAWKDDSLGYVLFGAYRTSGRELDGSFGSIIIISNRVSGLEQTNLYNDSCTKYGKSKL